MTTFGAQDERCLIQPTDHTSTGSNVQLVGERRGDGQLRSRGRTGFGTDRSHRRIVRIDRNPGGCFPRTCPIA